VDLVSQEISADDARRTSNRNVAVAEATTGSRTFHKSTGMSIIHTITIVVAR